jgi:hypothetical protein
MAATLTLSLGEGGVGVAELTTSFGATEEMPDTCLEVNGTSLAFRGPGVETLDIEDAEGVGGMKANEGGI